MQISIEKVLMENNRLHFTAMQKPIRAGGFDFLFMVMAPAMVSAPQRIILLIFTVEYLISDT